MSDAVKFDLPPGFSYNEGMSYQGGITNCTNNSQVGDLGTMNWTGCKAPMGDSVISFNALVP